MSYQTLIPIPDNLAELPAGHILANPTNLTDFPVSLALGNQLTFIPTDGNIVTTSIAATGSGYSDGVYTNVPAVGGSGEGATFDITVSGGAITVATVNNAGAGYEVGNDLTFPSLPGGGSGESISVDSINAPATYTIDTSFGVFAGPGAAGLVPDPGVANNLFLRDDGTWAAAGADVNQSIQVMAQRSITAADTFTPPTDYLILADGSGGGYNVGLPAASAGMYKFVLKKTDGLRALANAIFLVPNGADTIDGQAQQRLRRYDSVTVISDGVSNWNIV